VDEPPAKELRVETVKIVQHDGKERIVLTAIPMTRGSTLPAEQWVTAHDARPPRTARKRPLTPAGWRIEPATLPRSGKVSASLLDLLPAHGSDIGFDVEPRHHVLDCPVFAID